MCSRRPAHVHVTEAVAEDVDRPPGGVQVAGRQLEEGRLAGAVGAEHDPALAGSDHPVDVVQHWGGEPVEVDAVEAQRD